MKIPTLYIRRRAQCPALITIDDLDFAHRRVWISGNSRLREDEFSLYDLGGDSVEYLYALQLEDPWALY